MSIIDHSDTQRQCCDWESGHEIHHDVWLGRLRLLTPLAIKALVRDMTQQAHCSFLPSGIIPMIDIADFARAHPDLISEKGVEVAEKISYLCRNLHLPPTTTFVLADIGMIDRGAES